MNEFGQNEIHESMDICITNSGMNPSTVNIHDQLAIGNVNNNIMMNEKSCACVRIELPPVNKVRVKR